MPSKILLVDDSKPVRDYVRSSIEAHTDWTVSEAENGVVAVRMIEALQPHLVILDLSMPGMNGLETAERISAMIPGMPMIMFTMHDLPMLLEEAERVGIRHVFSKGDGFGDAVFEAMRAMLAA